MIKLSNLRGSKYCCNLVLFLLLDVLMNACIREDVQSYQMEPHSIVIVPDIQVYTMKRNSAELSSIVDFISSNKSNISLCLQTGDLTNNNTEEQWSNALNEYVDKIPHEIPHLECLGNHDYGLNGSANERSSNIPWDISGDAQLSFGDYHENYVKFVKVGDEEYGVLVLEYATRDETLEWAQNILANNIETKFIILTHAFLDNEGCIYGDEDYPAYQYITKSISSSLNVNESSQVYEKLCNHYSNIKYIICGHSLPNEGYIVRNHMNSKGDIVKIIMVNFQHFPNGGDGTVAILNISDIPVIDIYSAKKMEIITISEF